MAKICEVDEAELETWLAGRPPIIREMARRLPPGRLYRMKSTGQRVTLHSYCEDGTLTVDVTGDYNAIAFARRVFGVSQENLEECDLPDESETLGERYTQEEADRIIACIRAKLN